MKKLLYILPLLFLGCGYDATCNVESDTSWSGEFGGLSIQGYGDKVIPLEKDDDCVVIRKLSSNGYIRVIIDLENSWFGHEEGGAGASSQPFGEIRVCP